MRSMKSVILTVVFAILLFASCSKGGGNSSSKMVTDVDSIAYIIGMNVGRNLLEMDSTLNVKALCKGIEDVFTQTENMSLDEAKNYYLRYIAYAKAEKIRVFEADFLNKIIKDDRTFVRTRSGILFKIDALGDDDKKSRDNRDSLKLRYTIQTVDKENLFSSYQRGDTLSTTLADLRKGVQESVKLIGENGKITAWIPAAAAYGEAGDSELNIKPNATLLYTIEFIELNEYSDFSKK